MDHRVHYEALANIDGGRNVDGVVVVVVVVVLQFRLFELLRAAACLIIYWDKKSRYAEL